MKPARVWWLVQLALAEAAHLRLAWVLGVAGLAVVAGASVLREFNFGIEEARFLQDLDAGALTVFGIAQAILLTVTLVNGGVERGRPGLLLSHGVRRSEWLVAALLAVLVSLAWLVLGVYFLLGLQLHWSGHPVEIAGLAAACGRDSLRLGLVACFALATSVVCRSSLLAMILALALAIAAQLAPILAWAGTHGGPAARIGWIALGGIVPDFPSLDAGGDVLRSVAGVAGHAALYTLFACVVFARREL